MKSNPSSNLCRLARTQIASILTFIVGLLVLASGTAFAATPIDVGSEISSASLGGTAQSLIVLMTGAVLVLQVVRFFMPSPALHKQFAAKDEVEKKLDKIFEKLDEQDQSQSRIRASLYERIAILESAMSFLSGKLARSNDPDAERLQRIMERKPFSEEI